jgi:hypothetical protein
MAVFIAPPPKTKIQAAELRMFVRVLFIAGVPSPSSWLDAEVLCRIRASVSVLVVVLAPVGETRAKSNSASDHMGKDVATLPDLVLVLLIWAKVVDLSDRISTRGV